MTNPADISGQDMRTMEAVCWARIQQVDAAIHLRDIPDIRVLCDALGTHRQRRIHLQPLSLPPRHTGVWLADDAVDHIYYARDATLPHQEHIILHELAHLLLGHHSAAGPPELLQRDWFPLLDAVRVRSALARSWYDDRHEQEAELFASIFEQHWRTLRARERANAAGDAWGRATIYLTEGSPA